VSTSYDLNLNEFKFDRALLSCYISAMTPPRLTTESFSICYYDGNTGEVIELRAFLNNTGQVKDTVEMAVNNKPEYDGLVLWDINTVKEADDDRKEIAKKVYHK
tara:strand:- start:1861 stop:2172 length:312 start_codon:yes stop_codon:yes gene_type:complete